MPTLTVDIWAQQEQQEGIEERGETKMKRECISSISKLASGSTESLAARFCLRTGVVVAHPHWALPRTGPCSVPLALTTPAARYLPLCKHESARLACLNVFT